jgi:deoxyribodipyrimidine photo-lyase
MIPCSGRARALNSYAIGVGDLVVYALSRDIRVQDNWALLRAVEIARMHKKQLGVVYHLIVNYLGGSRRQWEFKLAALKRLEQDLAAKNIPLSIVLGDEMELIDWYKKHNVAAVVTDFCPLRGSQKRTNMIAKKLSVLVEQVDAHNVVPCWIASNKQEFGAYTLRPKIHKLLPEYLTDFPTLHKVNQELRWPPINWEKLRTHADIDDRVPPVDFSPDHAEKDLAAFLGKRLTGYAQRRNDPTCHGQSGLSPYLHYGVLSPQRVALLAQQAHAPLHDREAFLEELIVRRELADNFCFYNAHYDTVQGFPDWSKKTHAEHARDKRQYIYTLRDFSAAKTHDALWNAAQREMVRTGKMHGFMRMYWAKKILEWTPNVAEAMRIAIHLNDLFSLDGRDPNGYAGIAWSIGGVHDRAWFDRPIFGKIRYMNAAGCKRKFDVEEYIAKFS